MAASLKTYRAKRNFAVTTEPADGGQAGEALAFVIQKHWASRLHYDLRLELDGVMKSWAVPKGPSYDPTVKRMAVQVEDHPLAYNQFEGQIPAGQYGAGKVIIWDEGSWTPLVNARKGYRDGMLKFEVQGVKMHGRWALIRMKGRDEIQPPWLLVKEKDSYARPASEFSLVDELPDSVVPLRSEAKRKRASAKATKSAKPAKSTKVTKSAKSAEPTGSPESTESADAGAAPRLPGIAADLPAKLQPQLATLVDGVPAGVKDWIFEIKFDGYRLLARIEGKTVRLFTRNGHDWTHKLQHLAQAIAELKLPSGWLDGEIVVMGDNGVPSFQALQNAFDNAKTDDILYYLFDIPFVAGRDLRREPLEARRALLQQLFSAHTPPALRFSDTFDVRPKDLVSSACRMGLEGVIGKRRASPYVTRRSDTWIKLKCSQRQEFIIAGYTDPKGGRAGFGSLLLAVHDKQGGLRYAGNVGSGFDERTLAQIKTQLDRLAAPASPFEERTELDRSAHWVKPMLVAEVSFGEWTTSGHIRHSVFRGLRTDKPSKVITREERVPAETVAKDEAATSTKPVGKSRAASKASQSQIQTSKRAPGAAKDADPMAEKSKTSLRVTHPERVIDASTGTTKIDLVRFYALVAPLLLEHLKGRPVSLVRAPAGIEGELFFQKHLEGKMPGVKTLDPALDPGHPSLLEVPTAQAIVSAAQMNVVEFHTWNAVKSTIGKPDRMTFDLDPGTGVQWKAMQQAAQLLRTFLTQLGLVSYVKTSGGKGLHVVVPLKKQYDWDTVKAFSQAVAQHMARTLPQLFVAKSGPKNRVGKIFIDYLRNGFGSTTASAWSARARPGLGVSVPLDWAEIDAVAGGDQWTVANIHTRLDQGNDPWDGYAAQPLAQAMKLLDFRPAAP